MVEVVENYTEVNGTRLCWFERGQAVDGESSILLVHATGFHARCWDQVVSHLGDRHIIAVDMRGHGRSDKNGPIEWQTFGEDLAALIVELDLNHLVGVGHSMGGCCVAIAMAMHPARFERGLWVDPVIMSPEVYAETSMHEQFLDDSNTHPVARRRNHFVDADAMFANFEGRGSYASWTSEALHDYCDYGLQTDEENGGFKLACPPEVEAAIYMGSSANKIHDYLPKVSQPVTILRAKMREGDRVALDFTLSPTWPELAAHLQNGRDVYLPELTHFMPMQAPALVADYILGRK